MNKLLILAQNHPIRLDFDKSLKQDNFSMDRKNVKNYALVSKNKESLLIF